MREVYLDHSATTYVRDEVIECMLPYFKEKYGNPSSIYSKGVETFNAINDSRIKIAKCLNVEENEIYFVSCGSEADNMIIKGIARANKNKGKHIITTKIEHHAVINTCKSLESEGFEVTYLNVNCDGIIDIEELKNSIREDTILISIMHANNEIGSIMPLEEIGKIAKEKGILFHSDCVQSVGTLKIDAKKFNLDAISISAHKFYGPKGIGAAYINSDVNFIPLIDGGHQEKGKRAGTENVASIVGMGKAIEIASNQMDRYYEKLLNLKMYMIKCLEENNINFKVNGSLTNRLPGNLNLRFDNINCNALILALNSKGIFASCSSACSSKDEENISHVLKAIGLSDDDARNSIRFTFGAENTYSDIEYVVYVLKSIFNNI